MSALTRFFFRPPYQAPSTGAVIRWWEARRPTYNLAVGAAGTLTLATVAVTEALLPGPSHAFVPWVAILAYGVVANLFYCLGPVVDAIVCRRWGAQFGAVGPALFRYGFVFAVGLTLLPIPFVLLSWVIRLASALL